MSIEVLLVQFLVLAFTGAVWWLARRDLGSRPASPPPTAQADARELEQLCMTLEALVTDLTVRMEAAEQQLQQAGASLAAPAPVPAPRPAPVPATSVLPPSASFPVLSQDPPAAEPEIAAHAPLYALLEAGVTDPAEITRRTGLGRGEVDLILSLRARRAL